MGDTLRTALDWFDADAPHPGTSQTSTATVKGVDQDATPLVSEDTRPLAPPLDDLGPLEPVVRNLQARTKAPMAIALQSVLGVVCLAAQGHRDVETLGGAVPLSLFLITIAQSGERKSTCDKLSLKAVREFEERQADGYRLALPDHQRRRELFEARKARVLKEVKSADTAEQVAALEHLGSPPEPPVLPDLVLSNVTLEGLQRHLIEGPPSVGVFTDEGGGFFGGHGFSSENRTKTVSGFSELWDATPVKRGRAGDGMTVLRNRRVCLHVMVQGRIASKALSDEIVRDQGFFSRTLICWPESTIGQRFIDVAESPLSQGALEEFHERITGLLERPLPTRDTNPHELAPETLLLDPEARALLVEFFNHVEHAQRDDGPFAAIRGLRLQGLRERRPPRGHPHPLQRSGCDQCHCRDHGRRDRVDELVSL